ncbi:hypothetical protein ACWDYJ_14030 [Streptomyces sp. NPDC003042]
MTHEERPGRPRAVFGRAARLFARAPDVEFRDRMAQWFEAARDPREAHPAAGECDFD